MSTAPDTTTAAATRRWRPLEAIERRVLGVLVEKAKTTPEAYPLSTNALRTGCNQKNNRAPVMQLEDSQVEEACESLRKDGAVLQVQGTSRVDRYRHLAYEWLGVEKVELAVMAELLLRGTQTVGELRGRAARMEPIKDVGELQPILDGLEKKGLIQYLTPPGRGCIVTHTLYLDREMEKVRREAGTAHFDSVAADDATLAAPASRVVTPPATEPRRQTTTSLQTATSGVHADDVSGLREEIANLKRDFAASRADLEAQISNLRRDLADLNRQLGN
jgi:uncharacterized protein YceH (UPF0502 family)